MSCGACALRDTVTSPFQTVFHGLHTHTSVRHRQGLGRDVWTTILIMKVSVLVAQTAQQTRRATGPSWFGHNTGTYVHINLHNLGNVTALPNIVSTGMTVCTSGFGESCSSANTKRVRWSWVLREADAVQLVKKFPDFYANKFHYRVHKSWRLEPVLSHLKPHVSTCLKGSTAHNTELRCHACLV